MLYFVRIKRYYAVSVKSAYNILIRQDKLAAMTFDIIEHVAAFLLHSESVQIDEHDAGVDIRHFAVDIKPQLVYEVKQISNMMQRQKMQSPSACRKALQGFY